MKIEDDTIFHAILVLVIAAVIREIFAFLRERREYKRWQASNFKDHLEVDYFQNETRNRREAINKAIRAGVELSPTDRDIYMLCIALQKLGAQTFLGAVPLGAMLFLNGPQFVGDWLLVNNHVRHIRKQEHLSMNDIPFQRRHAEWLSILTFMWVMNENSFRYPDSYINIIKSFKDLYGNWGDILDREKILFNSDSKHAGINLRWQRHVIRLKFKCNKMSNFYEHKIT